MAISAKHWRLFDDVPQDMSTSSFEYVELRERNGVSATTSDQLQLFEFNMNDVDAYVLPSKAYLQVKCKIVKMNGDPLTAACRLQNSGMLFSRS